MMLSTDNFQALMATEDRYGAHNYRPLDLVVAHAEGVWLFDAEGRRYLDCISAYSAVNQGHGHRRIRAALIDQAARVPLVSRALRNDRLPEFLERLCELTGYEMALPMNTGAEAIETAIKLARRWGYRTKGIAPNRAEIVVFENNFHGRTTTIVSASSERQYREDFGPFMLGFVVIPFADEKALTDAIGPNTCAVLIEPIQGEGGVNVPPAGYLQQVARLCKERNVLLIADEIQTGLGRTGTLLAMEHDNIAADILVLGKALGGGFYPVSAALSSREIMQLFEPGSHGSTFGGNSLAAAVGLEALNVIVEEELPRRAAQSGVELLKALRGLEFPSIKEVRGRGLMIGLDLGRPARALSEALLREGIAAKDTHETVLRITPPLVIEQPEIEFLIAGLQRSLASF